MSSTPTIVQTPAQKAAMLRIRCPRAEIQNVMGPAIQEVYAALKDQGIAPAGPWFTHHLRMSPDVFELDVCVPVVAPVQPVGRVVPGELASATVARAVLVGSYEGLGSAWGELRAWVKDQGHEATPDLWEVYLVGPESSANPADWKTELNQRLSKLAN